MNKIRTFLTVLFFLTAALISAAPLQIDYYGVVTSSSDLNMSKMAQDIFYTQLNSIDNLKILDKRPDVGSASRSLPDTSSSGSSKVVFYAEISEERIDKSNVIWNCRFNAKTPFDGKIYSKQDKYDSYYKILTNAKTSIEELLFPLRQIAAKVPEETTITANPGAAFSLESLAGTWSGEPHTDKIVILRGGRGFIIYKNGATMNISLSIVNGKDGKKEILIRQVGKSNASFYPELSRDTALSAAASAPPIEWRLNSTVDGTLTGIKKTLIKSNSTPETVESGTQKVNWIKK